MKRPPSKLQIKRLLVQQGEDWHYCHSCQIARGAMVPKGGMRGITVTAGMCGLCGREDTLIPNSDYHWPAKGKKAIFD